MHILQGFFFAQLHRHAEKPTPETRAVWQSQPVACVWCQRKLLIPILFPVYFFYFEQNKIIYFGS